MNKSNFTIKCIIFTTLSLTIQSCALFRGKVTDTYLDATVKEKLKYKKVSLPFPPISTFYVLKGAFEDRKPGFEYTWNLAINSGTPVLAMESGKVIKVIQNNTQGGCQKKFKGMESYVWIEHSDKSIAIYKHVRPIVYEKQIITAGQKIGRTTISGFMCRPHLEISIVKSQMLMESKSINRTIPLLFKGVRAGLLKSRMSY